MHQARVARGDRILIGPGVYREEISFLKTLGGSGRLQVLAEKTNDWPIIRGSDVAKGWMPAHRPLVRLATFSNTLANELTGIMPLRGSPGAYNYDSITDFDTNTWVYWIRWPDADPSRPNPPQQVFYTANGVTYSLRQVGWSSRVTEWIYTRPNPNSFVRTKRPFIPLVLANEMTPGTFFFSAADHKLFIRLPHDEDPSARGSVIEVSVRDLWHVADSYHLKNLIFEHANSAALVPGDRPSVSLGTNSLLERCIIRWTDVDGLSVQEDSTVSSCLIENHGRTGLGCRTRCVVVSTTIRSNNYRLFSGSHHAGGAKMGLGSIPAFGIVFENCEVSWNRNSPGIWFDYCNPQTPEEGYVLYPDDPSHPRIQVKHNYIHDNGGDGILFEVSSHGLVYDNFLENNFGSGIALSTSCDIRILNNTILAPAVAFNSPVPLLIGQVAGGRSDYFSRDNRVLNNVMVTPNNQAVVAIQVAHAGTGETNQVRNNVFASNIYYSSFRPGGAQLNVAPLNIRATGYHSMAAWRKASGVGDEGSSNDRDPKSIDPELISRRGPAAPQTWPGPIVP